MKVIIVGGGIGGLAAYLALEKHLAKISPQISIKIYESHPNPTSTITTTGGGLGLSPNGLRAMSSVCVDAASNITATGFHCPAITFRNSHGTLLGRFTTGNKERYGFDQVFLARESVHRSFLKEIPQRAVEWGKKVERVRETKNGVEVVFEDGNVEYADLVIGADGVKSNVREAIFGDKFKASYQGIAGVGGFLPIPSLPEEIRQSIKQKDPVTLTFGPLGCFGYGPSSKISNEFTWWSTYEATSAPTRDLLLADVRAQLMGRHGSWKSPYDSAEGSVFSSIISIACGDTTGSSERAVEKGIQIFPQYVIDRLPRWCSSSGKIILLGDAAHPVPPESGQGVSCAVEDGLALALLLKHYLTRCPKSAVSGQPDMAQILDRTKTAYEAIRIRRIATILDIYTSFNNSTSKTWFQGWVRDWILWIMCKLPASVNDRMFGYDVEAEVQAYLIKDTTA